MHNIIQGQDVLGGILLLLYRLWKKISLLTLLGFLLILLLNSTWFLKFFYPFPHKDLVVKYSKEYKVDQYMVLALIRRESKFYPHARSKVGAKGLMQIMPETGSWIANQLGWVDYSEEKLYLPEYNIPMGIWYLAYLDKTFNGDIIKVLAAYNAGENKVYNWLEKRIWTGQLKDIEQIPYEETRRYIDRVLLDYQIYKRIYKEEK